MNLKVTVALVPIIGVAAAARFIDIGGQSYWYDEVATVVLMKEPFGEMLAAIRDTESTPPFYYVIAWLWSRIFGTSEVALRSLSAIIGTATVPVGYVAARALVREKAAIVVAGFAAVSPILVWYSQEARAYALLVLLSAISLLFFARAQKAPSRRDLVWWAVVAGLALSTHYFAGFLIFVEAAWLLVRVRRRSVVYAVASVAAVAIALSPLAIHQQKEELASWIGRLSYRSRVVDVIGQFIGGQAITTARDGGYFVPGALMVLVALGALAGVVWVLLKWTYGRDKFGGLMCLVLGVATIALPLVLALIGIDFFLFRNIIAAWLPLTIAFATALMSRRIEPFGSVAAGAYAVGCIVFLVTINNHSDLQRDDWRGVAKILGTPTATRALITDSVSQQLALQYYSPKVRRMPPTGATVGEIVTVLRGSLPNDFRPAAFHLTGSRTYQHFTLTRFVSDMPRPITPQELTDELPRTTPIGIATERVRHR